MSVREGTRVASIETGLAAAAAKLSQQVRRATLPGLRLPPMPLLPPLSCTGIIQAGAVTALGTFEYC